LLLTAQEDVLLFYINRPTVVVGSNQSIEAEVDTAYCQQQGIEIVRRISGGGAVYHDLGNINFSFIVGRIAQTALDHHLLDRMIATLQSLGIDAVAGARKEIFVNGKKVSGTAAFVSRDRLLFHGTLLYRSDLNMLRNALRGDVSLRGRRVASVPAEVANIAELTASTLSTDQFLHRLIEAF